MIDRGGGEQVSRYASCLDHPEHPVRMENDDDRQVSWLADHGLCTSPSRDLAQWLNDVRANRLQLREQPEH